MVEYIFPKSLICIVFTYFVFISMRSSKDRSSVKETLDQIVNDPEIFIEESETSEKGSTITTDNPVKEEEKIKALTDLKKLYAVLAADKSASTYVIHCTVHLAKQVREEIIKNGTYEKVEDSTIKEVQERHAEWMMEEGLAEPQDEKDPNAIHIPEYRKLFQKLPRLGVLIKLHKQNTPRYMARCHQTTLTQLGEWLTRTLKALSIESEEVWKDMFMTAGYNKQLDHQQQWADEATGGEIGQQPKVL